MMQICGSASPGGKHIWGVVLNCRWMAGFGGWKGYWLFTDIYYLSLQPLNCPACRQAGAEAFFYFFLDKKVTKNQFSPKASLPHGAFAPVATACLYAQIRQNLGWVFITAEPLLPCARSKYLCPTTAQASIVLPDFWPKLTGWQIFP